MHEHDHDIIMALAEGSLDPEAAARAEATVSACDECRADLELQRLALEALHDAPAVYLTAAESARLHDQLHRELRVTPAAPVRARVRPAWSRWVAVTAGTAAVFLAMFLVLPNLLGGGDDADTIAFEQVADDLDGGAAADMATSEAAAEAPTAAAPSDDAADRVLGAESPETTAAPQIAEDGAESLNFYLSYVGQGGLSEELRLEIVDQLAADEGVFAESGAALKQIEPGWASCVAELFPADETVSAVPQIAGLVADELGQERLLVALVSNADPVDLKLVSITVPECEIFETLP